MLVDCFASVPVSQALKELSNDLMKDVPTGSADDSHYSSSIALAETNAIGPLDLELGANSRLTVLVKKKKKKSPTHPYQFSNCSQGQTNFLFFLNDHGRH